MGTPAKCLLEVDPSNPVAIQRSCLGRLFSQLHASAVSEVYVLAGPNERIIREFVERNRGLIPLRVHFAGPLERSWKLTHESIRAQLEPRQSALMLNADVVYRTPTIQRSVRLAAKSNSKFRPIFAREVQARMKLKPVFGYSAIIVREDGFSLLPERQISDWFALKQGLRRASLTYSRTYINLNNKADLEKARKIMHKRAWRVHKR